MKPRRKVVVMLLLYCFLGAFIFLPAGIQRTNNLENVNQSDLKTPLSNQIADFYSIANCSGHMMSPDGTKVAYLKNQDLKWYNNELWVADRVPGSAELVNHVLISSEVAYGGICDWKGDWILYKIQREDGTPSSYYGKDELWRIKYDGTSKNQVTFTYTNGIRTEWWNHAYDNRGTVAWGYLIPGQTLSTSMLIMGMVGINPMYVMQMGPTIGIISQIPIIHGESLYHQQVTDFYGDDKQILDYLLLINPAI